MGCAATLLPCRPHSLARRRVLLTATLGFMRVRWREPVRPVVTALARWLNSGTGLGLIAVGMERRGYRLHLTNIDEGVWRATFSRTATLAHDGLQFCASPDFRRLPSLPQSLAEPFLGAACVALALARVPRRLIADEAALDVEARRRRLCLMDIGCMAT